MGYSLHIYDYNLGQEQVISSKFVAKILKMNTQDKTFQCIAAIEKGTYTWKLQS